MNKKYIKLSEYAQQHSIVYKTAWNRFNAGKIPNAFKDELGNVLIEVVTNNNDKNKVALYSRVSSNENKKNLETQSERLQMYAIAKGYTIVENIKEVGSGVNDNRKKLQKLLETEGYQKIIVEHKDRLTRFGFHYLETLLNKQGIEIEVINLADEGKNDLMEDLVSIIYSFSAKMYGLRRSKRKTESVIKCIKENCE